MCPLSIVAKAKNGGKLFNIIWKGRKTFISTPRCKKIVNVWLILYERLSRPNCAYKPAAHHHASFCVY